MRRAAHAGLSALMPDLGQALRIFDFCEPMEEEIKKRYAQKSEEPRGLMKLLFPTRPVRTERLYRAHCAEILERIPESGLDPSSGAIWRGLETLTRAELLGIMSEASRRHPLRHDDVVVMELLFDALFPGELEHEPHGERRLTEARGTLAERLSAESPERASTVREMREEAKARE